MNNMNTLYLAFRDELPDSDQQTQASDTVFALLGELLTTKKLTDDQHSALESAIYAYASAAHEDGFYLGWKIAMTLFRETAALGVVKPDKEER